MYVQVYIELRLSVHAPADHPYVACVRQLGWIVFSCVCGSLLL